MNRAAGRFIAACWHAGDLARVHLWHAIHKGYCCLSMQATAGGHPESSQSTRFDSVTQLQVTLRTT